MKTPCYPNLRVLVVQKHLKIQHKIKKVYLSFGNSTHCMNEGSMCYYYSLILVLILGTVTIFWHIGVEI